MSDPARLVRIETKLTYVMYVPIDTYKIEDDPVKGYTRLMTDQEIREYEVDKLADKADALQDIYESCPIADEQDIQISRTVDFTETGVTQ